MSQASIAPGGSVKATFVAAYSAVALAQITNALPGALNGTFAIEFRTSGAGLTWIAGMFMLCIVVFELTWGLLGDLFGRKRLLYVGATLSVIGTLVAAFAHTTGVMITAQAIGGIGAGILFPISLSMVAALTPDHRARARVIATWAGFLSLGAVISPVLAGVTSQFFTVAGHSAGAPDVFSGWRVAYFIAAAVAIAVLLVALRAKDSAAPAGRKLDIPGQVTLALGLIGVLYATVAAVDSGFTAPPVIASYVIGGLLLVAFVVIEARSKHPLIHLALFKNSAYSITGIVAVTGMFAFLAICYSTSVAVGGLALEATWKVGVLFVFIQGPAFVFIPIVARLIHRVAPRLVLTVGFAFMAASGFWLSTFALGAPPSHGGTPWTSFIVPLLLLGIGFALTIGSITAVAINTVQPQYIGMASATTNLLRDLGFALGPVVGSAIAFGIGASLFAAPIAGIASGAQLPAAVGGALGHIPPLGFLSGWDGIVAQFPTAAHALAAAQGQIQGAAGSALGRGFAIVYRVAGVSAAVSAVLTLFISGRSSSAPAVDVATPETIGASEAAEANSEVAVEA